MVAATEGMVSKRQTAIWSSVQIRGHASVPSRVGTAIATVTSAFLLLGASPALATVPGVDGDLAYETGVRPGIAVVNGFGGRVTPPALARIPGSPRDPAWSPDATQLAFTATRAGNQDIYTVARDGTHERRLTVDPAPDSAAAWSPDGGRIAFESTRDGDTDIYVMNADGGDLRRLTSAPGVDEHPAWSPDGRRVAFDSARDGNLELYVMAADGSAQTRLTFGPLPDSDPSWRPDGREIAFVSGVPPQTDLLAISPDSGRTRPLTTGAFANESPAWSPNGSRIAFSSVLAGRTSLYVTNAYGAPEAQLRTLYYGVPGRNPDWAQLPPPADTPTHGRTANATPTGRVRIRPLGESAFEPLTSPREIPVDIQLDTRGGSVKLTTVDADGRTTTTIASEGIFTLTQVFNSTDLRMRKPRCPSARASTTDRLPPPDISTLTTNANGRVRVHGRHTIASAHGTRWTTILTCSKTIVKVTEGTVIVRNRITRKTRTAVRVTREYSVGSAVG
jgi:hypothetical protein